MLPWAESVGAEPTPQVAPLISATRP
jgi:hypothetical protein